MANYVTPGIYVEEVSTGPKPIGTVGTSTVAFRGIAPKVGAHVLRPRACVNWTQFLTEFAGPESKSNDLAVAVHGFFLNGGGRCFVVNLGKDDDLSKGLGALEAHDEIAIVAAPGKVEVADYDDVLSHCEKLGDRVAILDAADDVENTEMLKKVGIVGEQGEDAGLRPRNSDGGYGAIYYPRIVVRDPFDSKSTITVAPSGHLAGVYARTDATRGVHKAPANESLRGALGIKHLVTREEQGELNRSGINVIRFFPDSGIRVWGARTLADEASEWRYINVRRLVNMIKESIENGTRWTVFEPNDMTLWKSVERNVRAFLMGLWRDGALLGETPEQAFFVRCDSEINPQSSIDAGRLITEIGIAPVKPAEFIIFRLGMVSPESEEGRG
jgi:phage tail sheath protein FI